MLSRANGCSGVTIKTAERKLAGGDLVHGGIPLMAWAVGNAKVEPRCNPITIATALMAHQAGGRTIAINALRISWLKHGLGDRKA